MYAYRIIPYHTIPYHIISHHITSHHITFCGPVDTLCTTNATSIPRIAGIFQHLRSENHLIIIASERRHQVTASKFHIHRLSQSVCADRWNQCKPLASTMSDLQNLSDRLCVSFGYYSAKHFESVESVSLQHRPASDAWIADASRSKLTGPHIICAKLCSLWASPISLRL